MLIVRIAKVLFGLLLLTVQISGGNEMARQYGFIGALNMYPLDSSERIGFDAWQAAIWCACGWLLYSGLKPKKQSQPPPPPRQ